MRRALLFHRRSIAPLFMILIAACSSDDSDGNLPADGPDAGVARGTGRAVLTERARVLDGPAMAALERAEALEDQGEQVELEFSEASGTLDGVRAGDVMIMGPSEPLPNGALLEVEEVTDEGPGLVLRTRPAALGDAFEELEIGLEAKLASFVDSTGAADGGVARSQQALGLTFPFVFTAEAEGAGEAELSGSLSIDSSIDLALDFDFAELELNELSVSIGADETFVAELVSQGESSFEESIELGSIAFAPITIILPIPAPPGTVPVVLTPQIALLAGASGSVSGEVEASVLQEASFTAGLGYRDDEFQGFSETDSTFDFEQPAYEAAVNVRAWAGPRLEVLLYGAVGPFTEAEAFVEFAANVEGPPPCVRGVLDAGLRAKAGMDFLADYETTLFDERTPLAHYDGCSDDPDAPRPAITWARTFGREGSPGEIARAVIEASDGSFVVVGQSSLFDDVTAFAASAWVLRLDPLGNVIWQRAFQRTALGVVRGVVEVPGGFLVAGTSGVMKLDTGGNLVWARQYEGDPTLEIVSIAAHPDGSFAVVGYHGTESQAWAMRLDPEGEVVWSRRFASQTFTRVRAIADGGYAVIGNWPDAFDVTLIELDAEGEVVLARMLDNLFDADPEVPDDPLTTSDDYAYDIAPKPGGGYVVVGEGYGPYPLPEPTPVGYYGTWVADVDADGSFGALGSVTHRAPEEALYGGAYAVAVRPNGSTLVVGRRADIAEDLLNNEDVLLIQGGTYDVLGGTGHDRIDTGTGSGFGRGMPLALTADGGAILALTSDSFGGQDQFWLVKLNRTGGINLPERASLSGTSFVNADAQSTAFDAEPEDVEVTARGFEDEVSFEVTDLAGAQQNP
jgi:hypothetical protein